MGPAWVLNMRLNWRASVNESLVPQLGQVWGSSSLSRRKRSWQCLQSTSGSVKLARWPDASQMAGRRQDGGVEADHVVAQLHHRAPPGVLDVAQQQHADGPVVVGGAEAAVDLGRREHEAAALRQVDDLLHQIRGLGVGHGAKRSGGVESAPAGIRHAPGPKRHNGGLVIPTPTRGATRRSSPVRIPPGSAAAGWWPALSTWAWGRALQRAVHRAVPPGAGGHLGGPHLERLRRARR